MGRSGDSRGQRRSRWAAATGLVFVCLFALAALGWWKWHSHAADGAVRTARSAGSELAQRQQKESHPVQNNRYRTLSTGKFLVANRRLADPNFVNSVVLIVEHDDKGTLGVIVNRQSRVLLSKALVEMQNLKERGDTVFRGGPVQREAVLALVRPQEGQKIEGAKRVLEDVYVLSTRTQIEQQIRERAAPERFRVYTGYAGWAPDQLATEMDLGSWHVFPASGAEVFDKEPASLWSRLIERSEARIAERKQREGSGVLWANLVRVGAGSFGIRSASSRRASQPDLTGTHVAVCGSVPRTEAH
jgi:putative transcriptional regulator